MSHRKIACALLAMLASAPPSLLFAAEPSTLERAYLKELAFLTAQKAEMEQRVTEVEKETARILHLAKTEVEADARRLVNLRRASDAIEDRLREGAGATKDKIDFVFDAVSDDFAREHPDLLIVDRIAGIPRCQGKEFDYLEYFLQNRTFADAFEGYEPTHAFHTLPDMQSLLWACKEVVANPGLVDQLGDKGVARWRERLRKLGAQAQ